MAFIGAVIDISNDVSFDVFAVGVEGAGNTIFMRSNCIRIVDRASVASPAWFSGRRLATSEVTLCNSWLTLLFLLSGS